MPDFIGTYQLAGDPPEQWSAQLRTLASTAGIEVRSTSKVGRRITIVVRVPKSASAPADEVVSPFLAEMAAVLSSGPGGGERAQLINISLAKSRTEILLSLLRVVIFCGLAVTAPALGIFIEGASGVMLGVMGLVTTVLLLIGLITMFGSNIRREFAAKLEKEQQAVHERVLVQQVAGEEDPKLRARLELARIALRSRASSMRGDADRLWRRSIWAYRGAFAFFLLAIAGPGVAAALLLNSANPDWHFMFGGLSLAAVPLGIGTALLRHDTKLREQYQEAARDVASLERYELALDYARIASPETYQATMQQVIVQLLSSRTGMPAQLPATPGAGGKDGDGEGMLGLQKIMDSTAEKAGEVVASIVPKKGS